MEVLGILAIGCGWLRGGHPERFGALVLFLDILVTRVGDDLNLRLVAPLPATQDFIVMLIFAWLAFRTDRWWPIVVTGLLALCVLVRALGILHPDMSTYAMLSAILGLWILLYAVVLAGVVERWLAGERAVSSDETWKRRPPRARQAGERRLAGAGNRP